ncbi:hypothetical protein ABVK25_011603 [Lepraria finkii]|uniref:Uncharacterized protein n=1 Tax=Lepraria finkii TaxID=1340010 RepID=A0ABR4AMF8_9LECA
MPLSSSSSTGFTAPVPNSREREKNFRPFWSYLHSEIHDRASPEPQHPPIYKRLHRDLKGIVHAQDISFVYANTEGTHVRAFPAALAAVQTTGAGMRLPHVCFSRTAWKPGRGTFPKLQQSHHDSETSRLGLIGVSIATGTAHTTTMIPPQNAMESRGR